MAMVRSRRMKITADGEISQTAAVVSGETRAETDGTREPEIVETTEGTRERAAVGIMEREIMGHGGTKTVETAETKRQEIVEMTAAAREPEPAVVHRVCAEARKVHAEVRKVQEQVHKVQEQVHLVEDKTIIITAAASGYLRGLKRHRAVLTGSNRSRRIPGRGIKKRQKKGHTKVKRK